MPWNSAGSWQPSAAQKLVSFLLTSRGYEVYTAVDAPHALELLQHVRPRLILMDLQLPGMDGFELTRKLKEAILSLKIQKQLSKSQILEGYLNTIYFGRGAYGVQAAAKAYFDKDAKDLTLRESAVLASVLNNPTLFDPANGRDAKANLKERYHYVLGGMADTGAVSAAAADKAAKRLPVFPEVEAQSQYGGQKGFMLAMVRDELHSLGYSDEEIRKILGGNVLRVLRAADEVAGAGHEGTDAAR